MSKAEEYENRIRKFTYEELVDFWESIKDRDIADWPSGKALEYFVIRCFEKIENCKVRYPYSVRHEKIEIEQIDGVVYYKNLACIIECKDHEDSKIDFKPIAKLRSQLLRRPSSTIGIVFSMTGFTPSAVFLTTFAAPQTILLWGKGEIESGISKKKFGQILEEKFEKFTEECMPDYKPIN
jgi:hypothetical protein